MHRGSDYQARVAAWLAVEMLAEGQGRPFSPGGRITLLRGETQESIRRWMEFPTPGTGNSGIITVRYLTYSLIDNRGKLAVWLVR